MKYNVVRVTIETTTKGARRLSRTHIMSLDHEGEAVEAARLLSELNNGSAYIVVSGADGH